MDESQKQHIMVDTQDCIYILFESTDAKILEKAKLYQQRQISGCLGLG